MTDFVDDDVKEKTESMTPSEFCQGLLAMFWKHRLPEIDFFSCQNINGMLAVYDVIDQRIRSIKGNEAKSPRYRDLLRIRYALEPGSLLDFCPFRHTMFETISLLRSVNASQNGVVMTDSYADIILSKFIKDDLALVKLCANAYLQSLEENT